MANRTNTASSTRYTSPYAKLIQQCARGFPGARAFYAQLLDYIRTPSANRRNDVPSLRIFPIPRARVERGQAWPAELAYASEVPASVDTCSMYHLSEVPQESASSLSIESRGRSFAVVVDGFISPTQVEELGLRFRLRPELFIAHLDLAARHERREFVFASRHIPSSKSSYMHIKLVYTGLSDANQALGTSLEAVQREADRLGQDWRQELIRSGSNGASILREMYAHSEKMFSLWQNISFGFSKNESRGWTAVIFLDGGIPTQHTPAVPWRAYRYKNYPPRLLPVVPSNLVPLETNAADVPLDSMHQHAVHRAFDFAEMLGTFSDEDVDLLARTPAPLVFRLMSISTMSFKQLLNIIEDDIDQLARLTLHGEMHELAVKQLRCITSILEKTHSTIGDYIDMIQVELSETSQSPADAGTMRQVQSMRKQTENDCQHLLRWTSVLRAYAETASEDIIRALQLEQTRRDKRQARELDNLTRLAFVFLPLSFVSSVFGMNVAAFADNPPLWTYFAVAVPCVILVYVVALLSNKSAWLKAKAKRIFGNSS